jgi:hypothetical protein
MEPNHAHAVFVWLISQQYFYLITNQPPATNQLYFSLRTNQHQPSDTSQTNSFGTIHSVEAILERILLVLTTTAVQTTANEAHSDGTRVFEKK